MEWRKRKDVRVVVPLPGELGLEVTARGQRLAGLDDIEVLGVNVAVLGLVEVLLCDENTLCACNQYTVDGDSSGGKKTELTAEEVLVNELTVGLGNQHLDD